jgi:hypothetical protein
MYMLFAIEIREKDSQQRKLEHSRGRGKWGRAHTFSTPPVWTGGGHWDNSFAE